ncbi:PREDICTED: protein PHOTOPERIOD-INDEPENDENT EARLY FLOWERING 1-like [Camelina sativa]|uniref:Protein PHOTOPERIOD-INDEPENDENT EARLY FLOWERING 1-like n=1 Tax=Camelina sativa TaxID=90675 RepID=A0ABM1QZM5_CAMSA|nr:PREDICTED: protein PHOTOPERIOD-INDEPENDENT EARLY FLOWERING 1-like [Camelina sativa]
MASKGGKSKPDIVMASKSGKSKPDNEYKAKRQKTLEAPKEPRRAKTHWDHVLEEMAWLSKDFESERKWKLAQAKKVALRASKGMLDQESREERKLKEEEQRLRKVALNISKDMKKFWMKVEKLVLYKHQLVRNEKKKKAMDKQLEFLLGQTERYSTMLAENLVEPYKEGHSSPPKTLPAMELKSDEEMAEQIPPEINCLAAGLESESPEIDEDYDLKSEDETEDDENTIEEDEKHFTKRERQEELEALRDEVDLPVEELLRRYTAGRVSRETSPENDESGDKLASVDQDHGEEDMNNLTASEETEKSPSVRRSNDSCGRLAIPKTHSHDLEPGTTTASAKSRKEDHTYDFNDEQEDVDFVVATGEEKDDETTLSVEEELAKADNEDHVEEISLLQKESEMPIEELLARYKEDCGDKDISEDESEYSCAQSEDSGVDSHENKQQANSDDENVDSTECKPDPNPCAEIVDGTSHEITEDNGKDSSDKIADAAAAARSAQPTGFTYSTTKVRTKLPFLLKHSLREYQHIGLDWLVTMYEKRLNGILADEMGLGKTIMTIALLAHLACDKGIWGPHLIVVPTSVMLNWETEFLKWCPAFKILTYFGSAKERKLKRQGWMKLNSFHVCITTYRLVIQDSKMFKRKKWKYLILDEAHLIKNWKSQRWQTLLNFNSKRRILLTGTPLQNDLMELWSLMHFLMPHVFQSHQEFKDWFCNPIAGMVEGQEKINKEVIDRLHNVLRPFLLRRLKRDVEKQLPSKHEHVIFCRLSKRQRNLYEDFIASTETQATLNSGSFFGMISIIMQLRKVCNHPDLFEGRPIVSSFDMAGIDMQLSSTICSLLLESPFSKVDLEALGFLFTHLDFSMTSWEGDEIKAISTPSELIKQRVDLKDDPEAIPLSSKNRKNLQGTNIFEEIRKAIFEERVKETKDRAAAIAWWNSLRCQRKPTYSTSLRTLLTIKGPLDDIHHLKANRSSYMYSSTLADIVLSPIERFQKIIELVEAFTFAIPAARVPSPACWCSRSDSPVFLSPSYKEKVTDLLSPLLSPIRPAIVRSQVYFPDRRLIQFDCGKLQELAMLLRKLKFGGDERAVITTSSQEDDTDVLDDVKQMAAAAAAAGQAISSFENQLRPIDRYAIRFLELWDPIIGDSAMENEAGFEEKEWELDHIEKYKDEMEAEIDDGEEPLVYEKWDADFATEAYRQQVEVLAQHQLMEDLENEAREREAAEMAEMDLIQNETPHVPKSKKKKKAKKAKYKSLKKGSLAAEPKHVKSIVKVEDSTDDDNDEFSYVSSSDSDMVTPLSRMHMKGKKRDLIVDTEEENTSKKKAKKHKKSLPNSDIKYKQPSALHDELEPSKPPDSMVVDNEMKLTSRGKTIGKKSITSMPIKRVLMIKPEKLKKGNLWSRDCVPSPDSWLPQEDAILCAMVHEYGPNWSFVSGTLYGMTAGGAYRGRYRHPAFCCERYRELIQRHIMSASDSAVNEKNLNTGSGKALLKVTEENIRTLLNVAAEQPDTEMLLQKHFSCLLSSIWRTSTRTGNEQLLSLSNPIFNRQFIGSVNHSQDIARKPWQGMKITSLSRKLLEAALQDSSTSQPNNTASRSRLQEDQPINKVELDLTLEFPPRGYDDSLTQFPPMISVSIDGSDSLNYVNEPPGEDVLKGSRVAAENRYRNAANACIEDSLGWASNTFPANDLKSRTGTKAQSLGKHKLSVADSAKSSKSKQRKLLAEQTEVAWVRPNDPNLKFDFTPADREDEEVEEKAVLEEEIEMISCSQWYDPFFTSGLDDCSLASEISEIE